MHKINRIWILIGLIAAISFIAFKRYIYLQYAYYFYDITSDGIYISYPYLFATAEYIHQHIIPKWSFEPGMGQNMFPFMLHDPFSSIIYLFGSRNIFATTIYVELLKIMLSGIFFYKYLKLLKLSDYIAIIGALLFAFCGFMTEGSPWFIFSFEVFCLALLLFSFELLYQKNNWLPFVIPVFLLCVSMPFYLYLFGVFIFLYAVFRYAATGKENTAGFWNLMLKLAGATGIGIFISGPFLLENTAQLFESPRGNGSNSLSHELAKIPLFTLPGKLEIGSSVMRLFSNDMMGSGDHFMGWGSILSSPMFYCGLPCLLLLPQVFQYISQRQKIVFSLFFTLWLIPDFFPSLRRAFWLFTGDYYRTYSVYVAIIFIVYSMIALYHIFQLKKVNVPLLIGTLLFLAVLLFFPFFDNPKTIDFTIQLFTIVFLIIYTMIFIIINRTKRIRIMKYVLMGVLIYELCYTAGVTANRRDAFLMEWIKGKNVYNNYFLDAVRWIQKSDTTFYRIDKSFEPASARYSDLDYSLAEGYNSTSSYNPFNQQYYVRYLQTMGVADKNSETEARWAKGLLDNPILETENRVKYFMTRRDSVPLSPFIWDYLYKTGDVKIYRNMYVLPFGFTYSRYIPESKFQMLSNAAKEKLSLLAVVVSDSMHHDIKGISECPVGDTTITDVMTLLDSAKKRLCQDTLTMTQFTDNFIKGAIFIHGSKLLYLSIPYDKGWHIKVDGMEQTKIILNGGMTGIALSGGYHKIELRYKLRYFNLGCIMSVIGIMLYVIISLLMHKKVRQHPYFL